MPCHRHILHNPPEEMLNSIGSGVYQPLGLVIATKGAPLMYWEAIRYFSMRKLNTKGLQLRLLWRVGETKVRLLQNCEGAKPSILQRNVCLCNDRTDRWRETQGRITVTLKRKRVRGAVWQLPGFHKAILPTSAFHETPLYPFGASPSV